MKSSLSRVLLTCACLLAASLPLASAQASVQIVGYWSGSCQSILNGTELNCTSYASDQNLTSIVNQKELVFEVTPLDSDQWVQYAVSNVSSGAHKGVATFGKNGPSIFYESQNVNNIPINGSVNTIEGDVNRITGGSGYFVNATGWVTYAGFINLSKLTYDGLVSFAIYAPQLSP